jgi:integrase
VYGVDLVRQEKLEARARLLRREKTIKGAVDAYLAEAETRAKKSYKEIRRYLVSAWAEIHELDGESVTHRDLIAPLRRIAEKHGKTTANRAKASLSAAFVWSVRNGLLHRDSNPCTFLRSWEEKPRDRVLSVEELAQIWIASEQVNETFGRMLRLLILTGCRRSEIADLSWQEIDFAGRVIKLPAERVKNGRAHVVPLAPAAMAILASTPRLSTHRCFVNFSSWSWAAKRLNDLIGLKAWVVHDIRRSCATHWHEEELGADGDLIELCLNHATGRSKIAATYDRSQRPAERKRLLEAWAELILRAAGEPTPTVGQNVVSLR